MRIIVTGGLGFIGSSFVNLLNRRIPNAKIVILDKMTYAANPNNIIKPTSIIRMPWPGKTKATNPIIIKM